MSSNNATQAIRKIAQDVLAAQNSERGALRDAHRFDCFARGKVTAVHSIGGVIVGYEVTQTNEDGTQSSQVYDNVNPFPGGTEYSENDVVLLWFPREGRLPFILATGGGGGGGSSTVQAYENYLSFLADS